MHQAFSNANVFPPASEHYMQSEHILEMGRGARGKGKGKGEGGKERIARWGEKGGTLVMGQQNS